MTSAYGLGYPVEARAVAPVAAPVASVAANGDSAAKLEASQEDNLDDELFK